MPSFPDGKSALLNYLAENVKYPVVALENGVQGRVLCEFIVHKDGSISVCVLNNCIIKFVRFIPFAELNLHKQKACSQTCGSQVCEQAFFLLPLHPL